MLMESSASRFWDMEEIVIHLKKEEFVSMYRRQHRWSTEAQVRALVTVHCGEGSMRGRGRIHEGPRLFPWGTGEQTESHKCIKCRETIYLTVGCKFGA